jgi:hypothetical protein
MNYRPIINANEGYPYGAKWLWSASMICPDCSKPIVVMFKADLKDESVSGYRDELRVVYPAKAYVLPAPKEAPPKVAQDFWEACLVLNDSPKASAALSRRCLQAVLNGNGYSGRDLAKQIDAFLADQKVPSYLHDSVDMIRNFGNFSAHPIDDKTTLQIIDVEPEEAQTCLDVLRSLFDFYYVQPERIRARKAELDKKLQSAGKPPSK